MKHSFTRVVVLKMSSRCANFSRLGKSTGRQYRLVKKYQYAVPGHKRVHVHRTGPSTFLSHKPIFLETTVVEKKISSEVKMLIRRVTTKSVSVQQNLKIEI